MNKKPHGINSPKSVEEFRKNLGKYFWTNGGEGKELYVRKPNGMSDFIPIDQISSFDDIYKITKSGSYGDWKSPSICPSINMIKDEVEFMNETKQSWSFIGYFSDEKNYEVVDDQMDVDNPKWYGLDNQLLREFFIITLGDYCGYGLPKEVV